MADAARILYVNLADAGTLSAGAAVATLPASNLATVGLGRVWRTPPGTTSTYVLADLGEQADIDCIALFGTNLSASGSGRARVSTADGTGAAGDAADEAIPAGRVDPEHGALIHFLPATVTGRYVRIDITDTSLPYIEAGRLVVGKSFELSRSISPEWEAVFDDQSTKSHTIGGNLIVRERPTTSGHDLTFRGISEAEALDTMATLNRVAGAKRDVMICRDPASANLGRDTVWGPMERPASVRHMLHTASGAQLYTVEVRQWRRS